jgi:peptidoglycan/LPS O-acetylase OafA/YrhL
VSAPRAGTPDVTAPPPGHPRFPRIDALRAIAALGVLLTHTAGFSGISTTSAWGSIWHNLDVGVAVFFVISGFLLYRPFVAADLGLARAPGTLDYLWRRVLRIVPAYWLALTLLGWLAHLPGVFTGDWWRYYLFLQVYSHHTVYGGISPAWTLCIEVTFYALLPLYAAAWSGRVRSGAERIRKELPVLGGLAVLSVVLRAIDLAGPQSVLLVTVVEYFAWFAAGMALASLSAAAQAGMPLPSVVAAARRRPTACWGAAATIYVGLAVTAHVPVAFRGGQFVELPISGTINYVAYALVGVLLALPAMLPDHSRGPVPRVLGWRLLGWLGLVSYGIYLWHSPLLGRLVAHGAVNWFPAHRFITLSAATAAAAVVAASGSYYLVERPLLTLKRRRPGVGEAARKDVE